MGNGEIGGNNDFNRYSIARTYRNFKISAEHPKKKKLNIFLIVIISIIILTISFFIFQKNIESFEMSLAIGNIESIDSVPVFDKVKIEDINNIEEIEIIELDSNGNSKDLSEEGSIIYEDAYVSVDGKIWEKISLSGNNHNGWLTKNISFDSIKDFKYLSFYSCKRKLLSWKCNDKWSIARINNPTAKNVAEETRGEKIDDSLSNGRVGSSEGNSGGSSGGSNGGDSSSTSNPEPEIVRNSDICKFSISELSSNSITNIDCLMNLQGNTINLPSDITLLYKGGDIINGTLSFSGGIISSELLSMSLTIGGDGAQVKDSIFNFDPTRWGIIEGRVSDDVALKNKNILTSLFIQSKELGTKIFKIGAIDAYFDVRGYIINSVKIVEEGIFLPSDFSLVMNNETHLRVQPNGAPAYTLIGIAKSKNVNITGGNLYGDRFQHDYSPVNDASNRPRNTHEWGSIILIAGSKNIIIDGVKISDASGDGVGIANAGIRNTDGTPREGNPISENIIIRNSLIKTSRRNGMSPVDGDGVIIENNKIIETGLGSSPEGISYSSAGTWPKNGIDLEAYRERNSAGELLEYGRIENVIIRGNSFIDNSNGDLNLYTTSSVTIEDNYFDGTISNTAAYNIIIRNNTMKAKIKEDGTTTNYGIKLKSLVKGVDGELNYNYEIYDNIIEDYKHCIVVSGEDYKVFNNKMNNCLTGIRIGNLDKAEFYNNEIYSTISNSIGYTSLSGILNNVNVENEDIEVEYRPISLSKIIGLTPLTFSGSKMISMRGSDNFIRDSNNIVITNNIIDTGFDIRDSENIIISDNTEN